MTCMCRDCGKHYEESKSRSDFKGYCSQKCLHAKARLYGYRKPKKGETDCVLAAFMNKKLRKIPSEIEVLQKHNALGSVPIGSEKK